MLIPSIDLQNGRIVQLVQGETLAIETTDTEAWIQRLRSPLGAAPTFWEASLPSLKSISAGIDRMPSCEAICGFSSTFTLAIFTLPAISFEISSRAGPIMRQGPHHSAQKSTTTGSEDLSTSCSKLESVTFTVAITSPSCWSGAQGTAEVGST